jgi:Actinobacteria/chloroflexi VLRF1 release factor
MSPRLVTVPGDRLPGWLDGFAQRHGEPDVSVTATTVVLTGADGSQASLEVPFAPLPPIEAGADPRTALIAHTRQRRLVGVLLVRRGGHAVGVFDGDDLIASKVGSGYVQGNTRAGGWSQQRFARRRANQARVVFADAADTAVRILSPFAARLDAVSCGGDRGAIRDVLADPRLAAIAALRREPLLAVPDPRLRVLQATPQQFRAVRITLEP